MTFKPALAPMATLPLKPSAFCSAFWPMATLKFPEEEFCSAFWPMATLPRPLLFENSAEPPTAVLLMEGFEPPPRPTVRPLMRASAPVTVSAPVMVVAPPTESEPPSEVAPALEMTIRTLLSVARTRSLVLLVPRNWPVAVEPSTGFVFSMTLPSVRQAARVSVMLSGMLTTLVTRPPTSTVTCGMLMVVWGWPMKLNPEV